MCTGISSLLCTLFSYLPEDCQSYNWKVQDLSFGECGNILLLALCSFLLLMRHSFAHSNITDLHFSELHNSIKNTRWKPRQTIVVEVPGETGDQTAVWDCVLHSLTKTRLVSNNWENCTLYMHILNIGGLSIHGTSCSAKQMPVYNIVMQYHNLPYPCKYNVRGLYIAHG